MMPSSRRLSVPIARTTASGDRSQYQGTIPAQDVKPTGDFMCFIEVMDQQGNGRIYPDLNFETPYIIVRLQRCAKCTEVDSVSSNLSTMKNPLPEA